MKFLTKNKLLMRIGLLAGGLFSSFSIASYQLDARTEAMGGVGLVSANYYAASFYNPSLVSLARPGDKYGFKIPSVNFSLASTEGTIDDIEHILDLSSSSTPDEWNDAFAALRNDYVILNNHYGFSYAFLGKEDFALSFHLVGGYRFYSRVVIPDGDLTIDPQASLDDTQLESFLNQSTEFSFTYSQILLKNRLHRISFGVTPKFLLYRYAQASLDLSTDVTTLVDDFSNFKNDSEFNADIGFSYDYLLGFRLSGVVRKILPENSDLKEEFLGYKKELGFGAAFFRDFGEISVVYNKKIQLADDDFLSESFSAGAELNLLGYIKPRFGVTQYLNSDISSYSAGLGLGYRDYVSLNFGLSAANDLNSFNANLDLDFRF